MARPWRNCNASLALVAEVNARWPNRDKASDGTVGDAAHASRSSDHNPFIIINGTGVVRARDIDVDGIDAAWLAEWLRGCGAAGDPRLRGGGYVIFNRRITRPDWGGWRAYTGSNPHTSHVHVSFSLDRAGFDSTAAWGLGPTAPTPEDDDMFSDQDRKLLHTLALRVDVGHARDQMLTALGVDPTAAPTKPTGTRPPILALLHQLVELNAHQRSALEAVARLAGEGGGATPDQIKAAITEALQNNTVRVDIAVAGRSD
jgi:hypothetical protein